jgi:hypothetical protein
MLGRGETASIAHLETMTVITVTERWRRKDGR